MRIVARYVSTIFLKNFLVGVVGLSSIFLFQSLLGELMDGDYPAQQVILHQLMGYPAMAVQMIPPSVLFATVFTFSGLTRTNELVACYSIGIGLRQLVVVILSLVFMVSCFTLVLQDRILPPLYKNRKTYYYRVMKNRQNFFLDFKQDKIWYRSKNMIYNLRNFDPKSKTIYGMVVYAFNTDFDLIQVIAAKKAMYSDRGWSLLDGSVTVFEEDGEFPLSKKFEEKELLIDERPSDFQEIEKEVGALRLKELYRYIGQVAEMGADTNAYEVKFHSRISLSFIPLVMALLALPFSLRGQREGGAAKDLGICLLVTFFYWLFYSIGLSLGTKGSLPAWFAAWSPSMLFLALAGGLFWKRQNV